MHGEDVAATIEPEEIPLSIICPASSTTMSTILLGVENEDAPLASDDKIAQKLFYLERYGWTDAPRCGDGADFISSDGYNGLGLPGVFKAAQMYSSADSASAAPPAADRPGPQIRASPPVTQPDVSDAESSCTSWLAPSRNYRSCTDGSRGEGEPPFTAEVPLPTDGPWAAPMLVMQWALPAAAQCALSPRCSANSFDSAYSARTAISSRTSEPRAAISARYSIFVGGGGRLPSEPELMDEGDGPRRGLPYFLFRSATEANSMPPPETEGSPPAHHGPLSPLFHAAKMLWQMWPAVGARPAPPSRDKPVDARPSARLLACPTGHQMESKYKFHELQYRWETPIEHDDSRLVSGAGAKAGRR